MILIFLLAVCVSTWAKHVDPELYAAPQTEQAGIAVTDNVQLPRNDGSVEYSSHCSLALAAQGAELEMLSHSRNGRLRRCRTNRLPPEGKVQLVYQGTIASDGTKGVFNMAGAILHREPAYAGASSATVERFKPCPMSTLEGSFGRLVFIGPAAQNIRKQDIPVRVFPHGKTTARLRSCA